jgi:hypothetical protein
MKIVDLDVLVAEPIRFVLGEDTFDVPTNPTTQTVLAMMALDLKSKKAKTPEQQIELLGESVALILSQSGKDVTTAFVLDKFTMPQMKAVTRAYEQRMMEINSDPN